MKKLLVLLLFTHWLPSSGQSDPQLFCEDINKDGMTDTLFLLYANGSGFSGTYATIVHGKTGERFEMDNYGCFCEIWKPLKIPAALQKPENVLFLEKMKSVLVKGPERDQPDPSFQWILDGSDSLQTFEANEHPYFDRIIAPKTQWIRGDIEMPSIYWIDQKDGPRIYYGHVHYSLGRDRREKVPDSLVLVAQVNNYTIYKTKHGIVAKKDAFYKWVFVTDLKLTGAPEKLRWASVGNVILEKDVLIVEHQTPPLATTSLFVIDLETGKCGRYKYPLYAENELQQDSAVKLKNGILTFEINGEAREESLANLIKALKNDPKTNRPADH